MAGEKRKEKKEGNNDNFAWIRIGLVHSIKSIESFSWRTCDPFSYIKAFWSRSGSHLIKCISHLYSSTALIFFSAHLKKMSITSSMKIFLNHNNFIIVRIVFILITHQVKQNQERKNAINAVFLQKSTVKATKKHDTVCYCKRESNIKLKTIEKM